MADVARKHGVSREAIRQRVNKYAKRHGLPTVTEARALPINDNGRECTGCGEWLAWKYFYANMRSPTGYRSRCKSCTIGYLPASLTTTLERFMQKIKEDENGCWVWPADVSRYPRFYSLTAGQQVCAYRWSYEEFIGTIPKGKYIVRSCLNRLCVNPEHLVSMSMSEVKNYRKIQTAN